jgi:hypothetical protein
MKHVIVIETSDDRPMSNRTLRLFQAQAICALHDLATKHAGLSFIDTRFNVLSAIAATHEMYNAPAWDYGASAYEVEIKKLSS